VYVAASVALAATSQAEELTEKEQAQGWAPLFDGKTFDGRAGEITKGRR